jgi:predicted metal-dependent phosphoesterase TrpH
MDTLTDKINPDVSEHLTHIYVIQKKVNYPVLRKEGYMAVDMHVHTRFSDSFNKVSKILRNAEKKGIGIAITDHNEIRGVLRALDLKKELSSDVPVVPGIEISSAEGPHILVYFSCIHELMHFYRSHIEPKKNINPHTNTNLTLAELVRVTKGYDCITSVAHPFSVAYTNVPNNIRKGYIDPSFLDHIDAIEVLNGAVSKSANENAIDYAYSLGKSITGGSDAHSLFEIGKIVTYARANSLKDFFEQIKRGRSHVMGKPIGHIKRVPSLLKSVQKHAKFLFPDLSMRYHHIVARPVRYNKPLVLNKIRYISAESIELMKRPIELPKRVIYKPLKIRYKAYRDNGRKHTK